MKALASLLNCAKFPEPSLFTEVFITQILCTSQCEHWLAKNVLYKERVSSYPKLSTAVCLSVL